MPPRKRASDNIDNDGSKRKRPATNKVTAVTEPTVVAPSVVAQPVEQAVNFAAADTGSNRTAIYAVVTPAVVTQADEQAANLATTGNTSNTAAISTVVAPAVIAQPVVVPAVIPQPVDQAVNFATSGATSNTAAISVASALPIPVPDAGLVSAAPVVAAQAVEAPTDSQVTGSAMVRDPARALGDTNPGDQANGNKPDDLTIVPGVADINPVTVERIKKILNFKDDEKNVYAVKNVPVSAMWSRAGSFIVDSVHQKAVLVWIVGRVDFKNISNAGRLVAVNIKPLDDADVDAANLLLRRYSQPQLKASDSKYNNIRLSFYVSQYETIGAKVSDDPIGDKFWDSTEAFEKKISLPFDNLKIGDVVLAEAFMRKYAMKDGGRKTGGYRLSFDLSAIRLLHAVSLKEHEDFVAEKNAASVAQATQGDDIKL